jgi:3-carboxy-cis,cis-muconate cycloisomerase
MALAAKLGKADAHTMMERFCHIAIENGRHLRDVLREHERCMILISEAQLDLFFAPMNYLGDSPGSIDLVHPRAETTGAATGVNLLDLT